MHQVQMPIQGPCWETANTKQTLKQQQQGPWTRHPGFFIGHTGERLKKTEQIDYATLNDRLVMQAIESAGYVMNKDLTDRLLQGKIARAKEMLENREKQVDWHTEA